jgi:hypothetical protein
MLPMCLQSEQKWNELLMAGWWYTYPLKNMRYIMIYESDWIIPTINPTIGEN